jgi:hypothetical protein
MHPAATPADLPTRIPVFPLGGAILLPRATMPLNIFEPRYLEMVRDSMAGDRLIGMIQPRNPNGNRPSLYAVGGLGKITQFSETGDGRFLIALSGLIRFRLVEELATTTPYRQVIADFAPYAADWGDPQPLAAATRAALEDSLHRYLDAQGLTADWDSIRSADDESLVNTLSVVCPFAEAERQALMEAENLAARTDLLATLMQFASPTETGRA